MNNLFSGMLISSNRVDYDKLHSPVHTTVKCCQDSLSNNIDPN